MTAIEMQDFINRAPWFLPLVIVGAIWSVAWQIVGLWTAARNGHKVWFVVFMFVHTLGLLEIIYLATQRKSNPTK
jgi:hypothetical protein